MERNSEYDATWHGISVDECLDTLDTGPGGLSEEEARARVQRIGKNELRGEQGTSVLALLLRQLQSPLIYLLVGAAAVSVIPGHYTDAAVIVAVIVINTALGFLMIVAHQTYGDMLRFNPHF
ncbi:MAG: cation-transporting P-type ATPase, partial [Spirochaetota bacterium]